MYMLFDINHIIVFLNFDRLGFFPFCFSYFIRRLNMAAQRRKLRKSYLYSYARVQCTLVQPDAQPSPLISEKQGTLGQVVA